MKKLFFAAILLITVAAVVSSCGASRRTSCPMAEGIIH
jgi:hypothetical protein